MPSLPLCKATKTDVCLLPTEFRGVLLREPWGRDTHLCLLQWLCVLSNEILVQMSAADILTCSCASEAFLSPLVLLLRKAFLTGRIAFAYILNIIPERGLPPPLHSPVLDKPSPCLQSRTYGSKHKMNPKTWSGCQTEKYKQEYL